METLESCVPPGFRFHPTEQELVGYYLKRKINSLKIDLDVIIDIDLYRMEPWDIQGRCKQGYDEQSEWYFFSHKDKKYPTGSRTNRATAAGFWKATGRDKAVISKDRIIGMRKTLVFYQGRAPNGRKTDWIMHEYRLQASQHEPPQEEGWVVCRAFKKPSSNHRQSYETWNHTYYVEPPSPLLPMHSTLHPPSQDFYQQSMGNLDQHLLMHNTTWISNHDHQVLEIPQLDSPSNALPTISLATKAQDCTPNECLEEQRRDGPEQRRDGPEQYCIDWKILDNLLDSQLAETASSPTPLLTHSYDQSPQNHVSHLLGCLRDSPLH